MKIIVGLGNPGPKYRGTRHNVGFAVLDCLAARLNTVFDREKFGGQIARADFSSERLLLLKPLTFMNRSGDCVAQAARNGIQSPSDLLVVVDDVNLPLGRIRLRPGGTAGGHNGLKSLIERLGTQDFPRLRLGVGQRAQGEDLAGHVLSRFRPDEKPYVAEMIEAGAEAVERFVSSGIDEAMNAVNGRTESNRAT